MSLYDFVSKHRAQGTTWHRIVDRNQVNEEIRLELNLLCFEHKHEFCNALRTLQDYFGNTGFSESNHVFDPITIPYECFGFMVGVATAVEYEDLLLSVRKIGSNCQVVAVVLCGSGDSMRSAEDIIKDIRDRIFKLG